MLAKQTTSKDGFLQATTYELSFICSYFITVPKLKKFIF
jgi:hypothetical protein